MQYFITMIFAGITSLGSYAQQSTPPPAKDISKYVQFTNADYDLGKIPSGKPLEYNVTIKNISKDSLTIYEVKAGCGCTTPKYRANELILPGKSTFITLGFNGGASGEFSKQAEIFFSGGLTGQLKFHGFALTDSSGSKPIQIPNNR